MSRLEVVAAEAATLRARAILAVEDAASLGASTYLVLICALFLACDSASPGELGMLDSIFRQQCRAESVEADHLLDMVGTVTQVVLS